MGGFQKNFYENSDCPIVYEAITQEGDNRQEKKKTAIDEISQMARQEIIAYQGNGDRPNGTQ